MRAVVVLIDGGFLRSQANKAKKHYNPDFIEKFALSCVTADEDCLRILYYDCAPYTGTGVLPVSNIVKQFTGSDKWLDELAGKDLFAVRRGVLKFRGFSRSSKALKGPTLTDADFAPQFEQKGVDMRIGLDIAAYSSGHLASRIILVTNDTDCLPALKFARKCGLQTVLIKVPNCNPAPELIAHSDFKRPVPWPP
jgi:uncharacterized LabA/DUF88 family protein